MNEEYRVVVTEDCLCAHYMHELLNYPREGLDKMKHEFKEGDVHDVESQWNNFYGSYYRVKVGDKTHDLPVQNAKIVDE